MIEKIISGGQTGADRAGLDAAIELGIPYGGWLPMGRKAEDASVPARYTGDEGIDPGWLSKAHRYEYR